MATLTEKTKIGDVIKEEFGSNYCRDEMVVKASQTLVVGEIVHNNSSGQIESAKSSADEVQTIGITGTLTAGDFTLTFVEPVTLNRLTSDSIAYNANTAAIQTAINNALGASKVTVGGTAITAMTFTFDGGAYQEISHPLIDVDASDLTGNEDIKVERTTEGSEQKIDGICLEAFTTVSGETPKKPMLVRGPATVNEGSLTYGTTPIAQVRTALLALGIKTRSES